MAAPDEHASLRSGDQIRRARMTQGLTLARLARDVGCSAATAWRWENEHSAPQRRFRPKISKALGVDAAVFEGWFAPEATVTGTGKVVYMRDPGAGRASDPGGHGSPESVLDAPPPRDGSVAGEVVPVSLQELFVRAMLTGLQEGYATSEAWERSAISTAKALGVEWHSTPEEE